MHKALPSQLHDLPVVGWSCSTPQVWPLEDREQVCGFAYISTPECRSPGHFSISLVSSKVEMQLWKIRCRLCYFQREHGRETSQPLRSSSKGLYVAMAMSLTSQMKWHLDKSNTSQSRGVLGFKSQIFLWGFCEACVISAFLPNGVRIRREFQTLSMLQGSQEPAVNR